ncbi:uncharacterized protein TNCV_2234641 [Trichonephila clavipes]|nr:uncharacterized protein TNCV_2234641 [Trichonephila clavipes]
MLYSVCFFFGSTSQIQVLIRRCNSGAACPVTSTHITIILESLSKPGDSTLGDSKFLGYFQQAADVGLPELIYCPEKKRASNPRKNIARTAKEIESSSSPNKISKSHTSKMETVNEIKIKQEENLDAEEEKLQQPITIIKNDIRFEDLQTFFPKYNLEIPIRTFIRNFESTCESFNIPEKQKLFL